MKQNRNGIDQINPSLTDPNYIMRKARAGKMKIFLESHRNINGGGRKILDVGSGTAPYSIFMDRDDEWIPVDLVKHNPDTIVCSAEMLPFPDSYFDIVICNQVLEYLDNLAAAINELRRVLRPGGWIIISNPAIYPPWGDASWRIMPKGYMYLLKDFSEISIDAECNTIASYFRTVNVYMDVIISNMLVKYFFKYVVFPINNMLGWEANIRFKDMTFVANYFIVSKKT